LAPERFGAVTDAPGVVITSRDDVSLAAVMVRKNMTESLCRRVSENFDMNLPLTPRHVASGPLSFTWAGPGRWLATSAEDKPAALETRLGSAFAGIASVANQSGGRSLIRVSGPRVRAALAKGVAIDLDPSVFTPGDTALTVVAHINVHFWQTDATPTYNFVVFRSFAVSFCEWLVSAAAEFGVAVAPPPNQI
jgi:sarcosine oxidase subunit gamma